MAVVSSLGLAVLLVGAEACGDSCMASSVKENMLLQAQAKRSTKAAQGDKEECHTAVEGEWCYPHVEWAMNVGVHRHPAWYPNLTTDSSFEEFQQRIHENNPALGCPKPCRGECRTATEGEACYSYVLWAMTNGVHKHPDWYPGLNTRSSFEDIQQHLHVNNPEKSCARPCPSKPAACHTSTHGESCHQHVTWAMEHGIKMIPEKYPGLSVKSSFEEFQDWMYRMPPRRCSAPACPKTVPETKACHTAVEGEACYSHVLWTMETGLHHHPDWYTNLTTKSSFEDIQQHLHATKPEQGCGRPCPPKPVTCHTATEGEACHKHVTWAMNHGIKMIPEKYPGLSKESSFEEFQDWMYRMPPKRCSAPACPRRSTPEPATNKTTTETPKTTTQTTNRTTSESPKTTTETGDSSDSL